MTAKGSRDCQQLRKLKVFLSFIFFQQCVNKLFEYLINFIYKTIIVSLLFIDFYTYAYAFLLSVCFYV